LRPLSKQGVDGRDEPGHDEEKWFKVTGICSSINVSQSPGRWGVAQPTILMSGERAKAPLDRLIA